MKETFRLTSTGQKRAKMRMFRKVFGLSFVVEAILVAGVAYFWNMSPTGIAGLAALAVVMLVVFSIRTWNNPSIDFADWGLHLDKQLVYLTENREATTIRRNDVGRVVVSSSGVIVKGNRLGSQIWIPDGVEDYEYVKNELESWAKS